MKLSTTLLGALALTLVSTGLVHAQSKIVLGARPNMQTAIVVVAQEKGLFEKAGLTVEMSRVAAGRQALEAMLGGQLDLAFMAEYPPVIGALQDKKFGLVTTISKYTANRVLSRADVGFRTVKDLEGKKIGTTNATNVAYFADLLLAKAGVKAEIVNVDPAGVVPALARGDIDAGVTFPDFNGRAKDMLGDKLREQISGDYISYFLIAASQAMIEKRADDLKKFLGALVEAEKIVKQDPAAAQAALVKAAEGTLKADAIAKAWPEYVYALGLDEGLLDTMYSQAQWIEAKNIIKGAKADRAKLRSYIVDAPLRAIAAPLVTIAK